MSEIIVLSDSDESLYPTEKKDVRTDKEIKSGYSQDNSDTSDFEFPEVHIEHAFTTYETEGTRESFHSTSPSSRRYNLNEHRKSSESSSKDDSPTNSHKSSKTYNSKKSRSDSSDSKKNSNEENRISSNTELPAKTTAKNTKGKQTEEKIKRQEQLAREKALKAIALKKLKDIKPGECMKFMEVVLDEGIEHFQFSTRIMDALLNANLQYSINVQLIPNSVTWNRSVEECYVDETNKICTKIKIEKVTQAVVIWNWDEAVRKVANESFCASVSSIKALLSDCTITLVIFGIQDYFSYWKHVRNGSKAATQKSKGRNVCNLEFKSSPEITRQQLEACLAEIQITLNCNSRFVNDAEELGAMICQYTKAIAEVPYKLEKNKSFENKFDWYVMGDNKNTVKVDKDGNGLKRLWQQQLCQFNLSSLEIAEAICSVYPSPARLMEAYQSSTLEEGINLLKDIPIRRAAGPLTTTRKVGLELSKKIHAMFTSEDGDAMLR